MTGLVGNSVVTGPPGSAAVAAGAPVTAAAGAEALRAGGNAVDAVIAGAFAATIAEQTLASLGGGGFLLVRTRDGQVHLRDFFVNTPGLGLPERGRELHFEPVEVRFSSALQTFHVGLGSVAVPSLLAGLLDAQRALARLPMASLVEPARRAAADGIALTAVHADLLALVRDLMSLTPECARLAQSDGQWLRRGELVRNPDLADFLGLIGDGSVTSIASAPFARPLLAAMATGGLVTESDLDQYRVIVREPGCVERAGATLFTNPLPSFGGPIIAHTLAVMRGWDPERPQDWRTLAEALETATLRGRALATTPVTSTGTTHISAVDSDGMVASLTVSNGANSGHVIPGTGIMLNNMLGEADLNPDGFHSVAPGVRMGSMMSPSILVGDDATVTGLGTGGSERIRSTMVQVLLRLLDGRQQLDTAVAAGRIHSDQGRLQVEPLVPESAIDALVAGSNLPINIWPAPNLYFGGVNAVQRNPDGSVIAVADGRRGGAAEVVLQG